MSFVIWIKLVEINRLWRGIWLKKRTTWDPFSLHKHHFSFNVRASTSLSFQNLSIYLIKLSKHKHERLEVEYSSGLRLDINIKTMKWGMDHMHAWCFKQEEDDNITWIDPTMWKGKLPAIRKQNLEQKQKKSWQPVYNG